MKLQNKILKINIKTPFILTSLFASATLLNAMEFGTMGNVSASMGGAGVALKSPFGLYYNPALIVSDTRTRIGYSIGIGFSQHNLDKLTNLNFVKMFDTLNSVGNQMAGGNKEITKDPITNNPSNGSANQTDNLNKVLKEALQKTIGNTNETDLDKLWKEYSGKHTTDHSTLATNLEKEVQNSNMPQDLKDVFSDFARSVDWSNFDVSNGKVSKVTIKSGSNGALDAAMKDLDTIFKVFKDNNINLVSQNGFVIQFSSETLKEKYGSMAIGIFNTVQAGVALAANKEKVRLIFGDSQGYYELKITDNGYTLQQSDKDTHDKYSLMKAVDDGDVHKIVSSIVTVTELPVGYAYNFNFGNYDLSLGVALKAMLGTSLYHEQFLNATMRFNKNFSNLVQYSGTAGIDAGALFSHRIGNNQEVSLGLVVKNINSPKFEFNTAPTILIKPQYRAGVAYNGKWFSLAFDADILPNERLNYSNDGLYSQVVGGGFKLDYRIVDIRGGVSYDFRQDNGIIFTTGINILGFLDIAAELGTKWVNYFGYNAPKYANVRIGGSFSW
ncbi:hypothetical protein LS73_007255 [Helicobacter muridarum]|uniref:Putative secreted protein n=1 Tax=Helicobacter muridarum TaxID=216 RepID=A0A377PST0_9HELI|nr:conjugal transfer protein TraF [Helicobacter muridarum]TLD99566.1 hypothetical protein LS73_007255 [Helicobacter muridarum]STQ85906.1 putative secreted protein [Helicobacter muridarum]